MCGIASCSLKKGLTQAQREKVRLNMQILGLYNDSRGGHGCGVYMNNQIFKGHDDDRKKGDTRLIGNLIGQDGWLLPKVTSNVMIMHARKATFGMQKEKNNHPFFIETGDPEKDIILVHNGSLKEVYTLCTKYGLKWVDYDVDSEVLATIIANNGLDVLNEYKGAAALVWTKPSDPDVLYVYHGASKTKKNGEEEEERPMWFLETKEGIYFSSMPESLNAIRDNLKQEVKCFVYNTVFEVRNGEFIKNIYSVDRGDVNVETTYYGSGYQGGYREGYYNGCQSRSVFHGNYTNSSKKAEDSTILDINLETLPYRATKETPKYKSTKTPLVYFHKGRFWYKEDKLHGEVHIDKKGVVYSEANMQATTYYFFRGVMLKNKEAYDTVMKEYQKDGYSAINNNALNFAHTISKYSTYPVVMLSHEGTNIDGVWRKSYYLNEKRLVGEHNLNVKWSNRTYHLKDGQLVRISTSIPKDEPKLIMGENESKAPVVQLTIVSNFDKVFTDTQDLMNISDTEYLAILEYIRQMLQTTSTLDPDDDEVKEFAHKMLRKAVEQKKTIRDMLADKKRELDVFLSLALELEDKGKSILEKEDAVVEDLDDKGIDEAIHEHELNKMEDEIEGRLEDAIGLVKELHSDAEALETYSTVDIATESADVIKKGVDNIRAGLNEVFDKHDKKALNIELTNI